ncbi:MAG: hypothetical protein K5787_20330 [Lentisphaeria bacterium]|nr:hypothetical protein [Lentisphaeria bacterium]
MVAICATIYITCKHLAFMKPCIVEVCHRFLEDRDRPTPPTGGISRTLERKSNGIGFGTF